jgi:hypothetical protein
MECEEMGRVEHVKRNAREKMRRDGHRRAREEKSDKKSAERNPE